MDTLRGNFIDRGESIDDLRDYDAPADDARREAPPSPIGQDERRMQVRAYNHWASMLGERSFPSIEDLVPADLPDFGPYSVLLDFTGGIDNPAVPFLGATLAEECGALGPIGQLSDVPTRSLLSRITDHYMQILANQAPIGFEAEFVNQRGQTVLYRGILLPFSSDDESIDFIYGVINWKEIADQHTTDELLLEVENALEPYGDPIADIPVARQEALTEWADGPVDESAAILDLSAALPAGGMDWPEPGFGTAAAAADDALGVGAFELAAPFELPASPAEDMALADWLASARELAQAAQGSEDRTRHALYAAIGRAYDFSLAAAEVPGEFTELLEDSGLTMQDRAPMTPVVKLVFGADYDKTRLTEYAAALGHAQRLALPRGALSDYLAHAPGGLKGVVGAERKLRREESGKAPGALEAPRDALARKLRAVAPTSFGDLAGEGEEFALLIARRMPDGRVMIVGEVPEDPALLERAARKLLG